MSLGGVARAWGLALAGMTMRLQHDRFEAGGFQPRVHRDLPAEAIAELDGFKDTASESVGGWTALGGPLPPLPA